MEDAKIVKDIVTGDVDFEALQDRILDIFMGEIKTEIQKGTPVDTGHMRQKWSEQRIGSHTIEYSNNTAYLPFHITGTGLYGPKHQMICAKGMSKKNPEHPHVMAWKPRGKPMAFRRCIKGMKKNNFLDVGIEAGIESAIEVISDMFTEAANVI